MADILIKNMTLPVDNAILHLKINADGDVVEIFDGRPLFNGIKAIELPEHGDLKDETDIIHRIEKIADADLAQDIIGEILASPVEILGTAIIIALLVSAYRDLARFQHWIDSGMPDEEATE